MRIIEGLRIKDAVKELFIRLNYSPESLENVSFVKPEMSGFERQLAEIIDENRVKAKAEMRPLCQDCGVAQVFVKMGKNVTFSDAPSLDILINKGVEEAYVEGLL